jgi:PKD repeat protein
MGNGFWETKRFLLHPTNYIFMKLSNIVLLFFLVACNYAMAVPTISISSASVNEIANGVVGLTVSLSAPSTQLVSVSVNTSDGTAISGSDYAPISTTLTFQPGITAQTLQVSIVNNNLMECTEEFKVTLSNPINATILNATSTVTITDTDPSGQHWPFLNNQRGTISGTPGEIRLDGGHARLHGGLDMLSPVPNSRAVYVMSGGGTITWNTAASTQPSAWPALITVGDIEYRHVQLLQNTFTNGQCVSEGTLIGNYFPTITNNFGSHLHVNGNPTSTDLYDLLNPFSDVPTSGNDNVPMFLDVFNNLWTVTDNLSTLRFFVDGINFLTSKREFKNSFIPDVMLPAHQDFPTTRHKIVFGDLDIVARVRDSHILPSGAPSTPNTASTPIKDGNNAPHLISYRTCKQPRIQQNASCTEPNITLSLHNIPANNYTVNATNNSDQIFLKGSNYPYGDNNYIITNNNDAAHNPNKKWDTFTNGDGRYVIGANAQDRGNTSIEHFVPVIVDNFAPYIKEVIITQGSANILHNTWAFNAANHSITRNSTTATGSGTNLTVTIRSSEPLKSENLVVQLVNSASNQITLMNPTVNGFETQFVYTVNATPSTGSAQFCLEISGRDYADNQLIPLQNVTNTSISIPQRGITASGWAWDPAITSGEDVSNCVTISGCSFNPLTGGATDRSNGEVCLVPDFNSTTAYDGCSINFNDLSEPSEYIAGWKWDFGDGGSTTYLPSGFQNTEHTYTESGCYDVTLTIKDDMSNTQSITKTVCVTTCDDDAVPGAPDCAINGTTLAGAGQTITLTAVGIGAGPFTFNWTTPSGITLCPNASPSNNAMCFTLPITAQNDERFEFSVTITDLNGNTTYCNHTVTVSGKVPDVEVAAFGSFEAFKPLVVVAFVDVFNLTGPEKYFFTIRNTATNQIMTGSCLNTWINGYECDLIAGLPSAVYELCVNVRDAIGTYTDCITIKIGNPVTLPVAQAMKLVTKVIDPPKDPLTGNYILRQGQSMYLGIDGVHPFPGWNACSSGNQYYVVLHFKNITTDESYDIGADATGVNFNSLMYTEPYGLDWKYNFGGECKKGTLKVTADVYNVPCPKSTFNPNYTANQIPIKFLITKPIFIDLYPGIPVIDNISVMGNCEPKLKAIVSSSCLIKKFRWTAYDINTGEKIIGLIPNESLTETVNITSNHVYFEKFGPGQLAQFNCKVIAEDQNGFVGELTTVVTMASPLRVNLPNTIGRCSDAITPMSDESLVVGGSGNYSFTWSFENGAADILSCLGCSNPEINTINASGSYNYNVTVTDVSSGCSIIKSVRIDVNSLSIVPISNLLTCNTNPSYRLGPVLANGGAGNYTYLWSPASLLDNATSPNPMPLLPANVTLQTFDVTVTDEFGCSALSGAKVLADGATLPVNAGPDPVTICFGTELLLGNNLPLNFLQGYYQWTSDNPLFATTNTPNVVLSKNLNRHPGVFHYTVKAITGITGCVSEDKVTVTVRPPIKYNGYESQIHPALLGEKVKLWDDNYNFPQQGTYGVPLTYSWKPSNVDIPTDIELTSVINVPNQGKFVPTAQNPSRLLEIKDANNCLATFQSNKYIVTTEAPEFWISANKPVFCLGSVDPMCFDIQLDAHLNESQSSLLPQELRVRYEFSSPNNAQAPK